MMHPLRVLVVACALFASVPASFAAAVCSSGPGTKPPKADYYYQDTSGAFRPIYLWTGAAGGEPSRSRVTNTEGWGANWRLAAVEDFDRDGKRDLFLQNQVEKRLWFWAADGANLPGSSPQTEQTMNVSSFDLGDWLIAGAGDFDGDGQVDLVVRSTAAGVIAIWRLSYTEGTLVRVETSTTLQVSEGGAYVDWRVAAVGDFNRDGYLDLALQHAKTGQVQVWYRGANGQVQLPAQFVPHTDPIAYPSISAWRLIGASDANADGCADFIFQNKSTGRGVVWYMNDRSLLASRYLEGTDADPPDAPPMKAMLLVASDTDQRTARSVDVVQIADQGVVSASYHQPMIVNGLGVAYAYVSGTDYTAGYTQWKVDFRPWGEPAINLVSGLTNVTLETDARNNSIYVVTTKRTDQAYSELQRFDYGTSYVPAFASWKRIETGSSGKYSMYFEPATSQIVLFTHSGNAYPPWNYRDFILVDGGTGTTVGQPAKVTTWKGDANPITEAQVRALNQDHPSLHYPLITGDGSGNLFAAWTSLVATWTGDPPAVSNPKYFDARAMKRNISSFPLVANWLTLGWTQLYGTQLTAPVRTDREAGAPPTADLLTEPEEEGASWLSNMLYKEGKLHFAFGSRYKRRDLNDPNNLQPKMTYWRGKRVVFVGQTFCSTRAAVAGAPLFCAGMTVNGIGVLVSRNDGWSWEDYAEYEIAGRQPTGCNFMVSGSREYSAGGDLYVLFSPAYYAPNPKACGLPQAPHLLRVSVQ